MATRTDPATAMTADSSGLPRSDCEPITDDCSVPRPAAASAWSWLGQGLLHRIPCRPPPNSTAHDCAWVGAMDDPALRSPTRQL
jgi:hypothetical protein